MQDSRSIPATFMNAGKRGFPEHGRPTDKMFLYVALQLGMLRHKNWRLVFKDECFYTTKRIDDIVSNGLMRIRIERYFPAEGLTRPREVPNNVYHVNWPDEGHMRFGLYVLGAMKAHDAVNDWVTEFPDGSLELNVPPQFEFHDRFLGESELNKRRRLILENRGG